MKRSLFGVFFCVAFLLQGVFNNALASEIGASDVSVVADTENQMSFILYASVEKQTDAIRLTATFDQSEMVIRSIAVAPNSPFTVSNFEQSFSNQTGSIYVVAGSVDSIAAGFIPVAEVIFEPIKNTSTVFFSEVYVNEAGTSRNQFVSRPDAIVLSTETSAAGEEFFQNQIIAQTPKPESFAAIKPLDPEDLYQPVVTQIFPPIDTTTESAWQKTADIQFGWQLPADVYQVAVSVSADPIDEPLPVFEPPITQYTALGTSFVEGQNYLHVQFRNRATGWLDVEHHRFNIDNVPPTDPIISTIVDTESGFPILFASSTDTGAGVERYGIAVSGRQYEISPGDMVQGYHLSDLEDGLYTVTITAIDAAGNRSVAETIVTVAAGWVSSEAASTEENLLTAPSNVQEKSTISFINQFNSLPLLEILFATVFSILLFLLLLLFIRRDHKNRTETSISPSSPFSQIDSMKGDFEKKPVKTMRLSSVSGKSNFSSTGDVEKKLSLKEDTQELQESCDCGQCTEMKRSFMALRNELDTAVTAMRMYPRTSKREKEILGTLENVLTVARAQAEEGVDDV